MGKKRKSDLKDGVWANFWKIKHLQKTIKTLILTVWALIVILIAIIIVVIGSVRV